MNTDGHGCPQADGGGEQQFSATGQQLKEISPQADYKGRQQGQHETTWCPQADGVGEQQLSAIRQQFLIIYANRLFTMND